MIIFITVALYGLKLKGTINLYVLDLENIIKIQKFMERKKNILTYLCGTTTNIWLRPVQEDLSMTACLEHSASNL
jgi:hypothetical protein